MFVSTCIVLCYVYYAFQYWRNKRYYYFPLVDNSCNIFCSWFCLFMIDCIFISVEDTPAKIEIRTGARNGRSTKEEHVYILFLTQLIFFQ